MFPQEVLIRQSNGRYVLAVPAVRHLHRLLHAHLSPYLSHVILHSQACPDLQMPEISHIKLQDAATQTILSIDDTCPEVSPSLAAVSPNCATVSLYAPARH